MWLFGKIHGIGISDGDFSDVKTVWSTLFLLGSILLKSSIFKGNDKRLNF